jgi:hypothetical protein
MVQDERVNGGQFWHMASNDFFREYDGPAPSVVFIDADHRYEQARRDYLNAEAILIDDGVIFLHDTWPVEEANEEGTGTVWKLGRELEQDERVNTFTFRRYPGLTMVQSSRLERYGL